MEGFEVDDLVKKLDCIFGALLPFTTRPDTDIDAVRCWLAE
jgi:hypothetical protein